MHAPRMVLAGLLSMIGSRRISWAPFLLLLALVPNAALGVSPALAGAEDRVLLLEENDSLYFNTDRHYTQGLRFSDLRPDLDPLSGWNEPFDFFGRNTPVFASAGQQTARRYAVFGGQSFFTPKNLSANPPGPADRPYGAWLYAGLSLLQESDGRRLENLELELGVVGPWAFGREVQNDYHQFIGTKAARGWESQIRNEPGATLSYERLWRVPVVPDEDWGIDIVPGLGATVGNVFTYGEIGALLRIGTGLMADYGPARIRPALSGTDYFDGKAAGGGPGFYFFVGTQGRVVGRNIFLDGNSFRQSPSVDKKILVADLQAGFSVFWSDAVRVDFSVVERSEEFEGQHGPDPIGTASLAFSW